jgi:hypothetical protein
VRTVCAIGFVVVCVVASASAATAAAPPGATAQCRDGTYSFSTHRSGTCSHHGGVAMWLTGGGSTGAAGTTGGGTVAVGSTVLLEPRTRVTGCVSGPNPDRRCSPGAYYTKLTRSVLCSAGFRTGSVRNVSESEKFAVETEYGIAPGHYGRTLEIDHIVPLELGGSNDIANLFPERADAHPGYHAKDRLENRAHDLVCAGSLPLRLAQARIASDWQSLYRALYGIAPSG